MLTACFPKDVDNSTSESETEDKSPAVLESEDETNVEEYNALKDPEINRKFDFDKDLHFIHISEVNNNALNERPLGGIESQDVYYDKNENVLYFFYDSKLPTSKTEMIVVQDKFNHDYLLEYDLHLIEGNSASLTFNFIDNEYVNNDNRLFLDKMLDLKVTDDKLSVSIDGNEYEVNNGESLEVPIENGDVKSKLVIANYGKLNTLENMSYHEIEGAYVEHED